jgi:drug/metabolite transporter (DMT)-like permease
MSAQLQIHICVVLWGFTAILGKLITLPATALVWWRMLIVTALLALLPRVWRSLRAMSWSLRRAYCLAGAVVGLHWLTFYASIKLSNASVGATCIALAPVFLAFVEPVIARRRFDPKELIIGVAAVPGVVLVVGGIPSGMHVGVAVGALSAFLVAIFSAINKRYVELADPLAVTALELGAGTVVLTLVAPLLPHTGAAFLVPDLHDGALLVVLAIACTIVPFTLSLVALRKLTAFNAQLAVNLEPVYAIIIATAFLGEHRELNAGFYLGVAIILAAVVAYPLLRKKPVAEAG